MAMTTSSKPRRVLIDLETYSSADLAKTGVHKYVEADDFEILLMSYALDDQPVQIWDFVRDGAPGWLPGLLADPEIVKVAHNCAFERACLHKALGIYSPMEQWIDTMHLAAQNGLPMTLEAAGAALQLNQQKLDTGKALIRYFCKPCAPTKTNGGRTRNLPEHAPDKWEAFKAYCVRDTEAERELLHRLQDTPITDTERQVECLDARINERGIGIDLGLAERAIDMDAAYKATRLAEMQQLTGLTNPNSVSQLKTWLASRGMHTDSLDKKALAELLARAVDPTTRRVLQLRQLLGKSSTSKYVAMQTATCKDGRIRGTLQYYGAGRTGRWAGRLLQVQNLPQNHLDQIDRVREIVRRGDLDGLEMLYDSVPDVLSQLIRTAIVAGEGRTFLVADYHAIEAVCIAYLAHEQWRMDVFAGDGKIYEASYAQAFGVPKESVKKGSPERQKGKIMELACIAEGQLVLTDKGPTPIEDVTLDMRVWDGIAWVSHGGVVYRGVKEVIEYGGLEATPDHVVWAEVRGASRPIRLDHAAASGAHLTRTGGSGHAIRLGRDHRPGEEMEPKMESLLRPDPVQRLWEDPVAGARQPEGPEVKGVSKLLPTPGGPPMAGSEIYGSKAAMHKPQRPQLPQLRGPGDSILLRQRDSSGALYDRDAGSPGSQNGDRQDRCQRQLRARQSPMGNAPTKLPEPEAIPRKVRVYDIRDAGPRHRYTVSGVLVHNCGYGGGVGALKAFGADKLGLDDDQLQHLIDRWRAASPHITALWRACERAAKAAIRTPGSKCTLANGCAYRRDRDALRCILPSGRRLSYWGAWLDEDNSIRFWGQNQTTRKWERAETWGGKLTENMVQAFARDILAEAMLRLEAAGYPVAFTVHDECIVEAPEGAHWEDVAEIMGQPVSWAPGLDRYLHADGYETPFYKKD